MAVAGILVARDLMYRHEVARSPSASADVRTARSTDCCYNKYYVDEIYDAVFVNGTCC